MRGWPPPCGTYNGYHGILSDVSEVGVTHCRLRRLSAARAFGVDERFHVHAAHVCPCAMCCVLCVKRGNEMCPRSPFRVQLHFQANAASPACSWVLAA
eukprot:6229869-Prymnesium_polylepis.2